MALSKYLAFDFGAESGRAIIGILDGNTFQIEEIHRFQNRQIEILGHLHWDVLTLFEEIKTGLKLAVQKGHSDIQSIGIDTWGVDFGFVGNDNALFGFPYAIVMCAQTALWKKHLKKFHAKNYTALPASSSCNSTLSFSFIVLNCTMILH